MKPKLNHVRVFGCAAYAHVPSNQRQKLDKNWIKYRFVGYSKESKGYRLLDETQKIYIRQDVVFNEKDFGHSWERSKPPFENIETEAESMSNQDDAEIINDRNEENRPEENRRSQVRYGLDEYANTVTEKSIVQYVAYSH